MWEEAERLEGGREGECGEVVGRERDVENGLDGSVGREGVDEEG